MSDLRCDVCGRFMRNIYDEYTPFGNANDMEPPDAVYMCKKCSEILKQLVSRRCQWNRERGFNRLAINWIPSNAEKDALRENGYVIAGYKGDAWAEGFKQGCVPKGYEIWTWAESQIKARAGEGKS